MACLSSQIDMVDKGDAQVQTLSGGMKRRLNVAMALIGNPKYVSPRPFHV